MSLSIVLIAGIVLALAAAVEGWLAQRSLRARLADARRDAPADAETGLLVERAFEVRVAGELSRAQRHVHDVWCAVWRVGDDATAAVGAALAALEFPVVAFRLGAGEFAAVRAAVDAGERDAIERAVRAAAGDCLTAHGEASFPVDAPDAATLLQVARERSVPA